MNVSIIGAGYVGLVSGVCLAEVGHQATCADLDADKVRGLNAGQPPIHEPGLAELLSRHVGRRFRATTDLTAAVRESDLTLIAVGTPFDGTKIDLSCVRAAAEQVGRALAAKRNYHVVAVKSTVVPGTSDEVVGPGVARAAGRAAGEGFGLAVNPEFLSEGTAVRDFLHPDRIVLGGDERSLAALRALYAPFPCVPLVETTTRGAEMIKYASNSLLATLISFSNEIGNLCSRLDVDAADVFRGVHLSQYLTAPDAGSPGKPAGIASFLWPGCGFGGSCLPKDVAALVAHGRARGEAMPLLSAVLEINQRQPQRVVELLRRRFANLRGLRVAVMGLAFKPDTDDVRESPALPLIKLLLAEQTIVRAYDPIANDNAKQALGEAEVTFCDSLDEALAGADVALLVTAWDEFRTLPDRLRAMSQPPLVVDGRRLIDPTFVDRYEAIGFGKTRHAVH